MARPRPLPADHDVERYVLGACLISPAVVDTVVRALTLSDFHLARHQATWAAIQRLWATGQPIDPVTVHALDPELDRAELVELQIDAPSIGNVGRYAAILVELANRRRMLSGLSEAQEILFGEAPIDDALNAIRSAQASMSYGTASEHAARNVEDLLEDDGVQNDWVMEGFLRGQERLMLTGDEGIGKAWYTTELAFAASQGLDPFDAGHRYEPTTVLQFDLENNITDVQKRIRGIYPAARRMAGAQWDPDRMLIEHRPGGIDLMERADRTQFMSLIERHRPGLVLITPLYGCALIDWDKSTEVRRVQAVLNDVREHYGCAIVLETHSSHDQLRPTGSRQWMRWCEFGHGIKQLPMAADAAESEAEYELARWRRDRDPDRSWPRKLTRGGDWPWTAGEDDAPFG